MKKSKKKRPEQEIWTYSEKTAKKFQNEPSGTRNLDIQREKRQKSPKGNEKKEACICVDPDKREKQFLRLIFEDYGIFRKIASLSGKDELTPNIPIGIIDYNKCGSDRKGAGLWTIAQ